MLFKHHYLLVSCRRDFDWYCNEIMLQIFVHMTQHTDEYLEHNNDCYAPDIRRCVESSVDYGYSGSLTNNISFKYFLLSSIFEGTLLGRRWGD